MASKHPAVSATNEEPTTVDPGALDNWQDEKTVADATGGTTNTNDVVGRGADPAVVVKRSPLGSESETVDELTIEEQRANLRIPRPPAPATLPKAVLVVRTGPHEGQRFPIGKTSLTVGRALDNDVVLADTSISRHHLKLEFDGLAFFLQDLGSGNGTVINGRDEDERYKLLNRDALELGRSIITFECEAMSAKAPSISPPLPRPVQPQAAQQARPAQGKAGKPHARPTVQLRSTGEHPEFLGEVDDDASTIAGQRGPGDLLAPGGPRGQKPSVGPRDLVMPREARPANNPRSTMASPAVPPPNRAVDPRHPSARPTVARSTAPPIIAPVSLDEEEPTTSAQPPRRPQHQSQQPLMRTMRAPQGAAAPRARPTSVPPPRSGASPALPRSVPRTSAPPMHGNTGAQRQHPSASSIPLSHHSQQQPIYPSAPAQYSRSGAAVALSPRSAMPMGVMSPVTSGGNRKWIAAIALLATATIVGVAVAALSGGGESEGSGESGDQTIAATTLDSGPIVRPMTTVDAGPTIKPLPDASERVDESLRAPQRNIVKPEEIGNYETVLASLPPAAGRIDPNDVKKDDVKKDDIKKDDIKKDDVKKDDVKKDDDKKSDAAFVKRAKSQALAAYRDRDFGRAASLSSIGRSTSAAKNRARA